MAQFSENMLPLEDFRHNFVLTERVMCRSQSGDAEVRLAKDTVGIDYAVKIVNKKSKNIHLDEIKREISVLQDLGEDVHPVQYESSDKVYVVVENLKGGEMLCHLTNVGVEKFLSKKNQNIKKEGIDAFIIRRTKEICEGCDSEDIKDDESNVSQRSLDIRIKGELNKIPSFNSCIHPTAREKHAAIRRVPEIHEV